MARKRKTALDPCKVKIPRLKKLGDEALFNVWDRLRRMKGPAAKKLAQWASNYGAAKLARRVHADAKVRSDSVRGYLRISRRLEGEFKKLRVKKCGR